MNNVSLNDSIGLDKDGNEITLEEVIQEETKESLDIIHFKDNVNFLKKYLDVITKREKDALHDYCYSGI